MVRKAIPLALTALLPLMALNPALAQDAAKPRRVGWIAITSEEFFHKQAAGVIGAAFAELGYYEGKNLVLDMRFAAGRFERGRELAEELLASGAEVLVTGGVQLSVAALQVTKTVPIVGAGCGLEQLVESLARPGRNLTGMTCPAWELGGKQLQLPSELLPGERRLSALALPGSACSQSTGTRASGASPRWRPWASARPSRCRGSGPPRG